MIQFVLDRVHDDRLVEFGCKFLRKRLDDIYEIYPLDVIHGVCGHGQLCTDGSATYDSYAHVLDNRAFINYCFAKRLLNVAHT